MENSIDDPQIIKAELGFLLRRYARTPNTNLARQIYDCFQKLLPYLDQLGLTENRCSYYRQLHTWQLRSLA